VVDLRGAGSSPVGGDEVEWAASTPRLAVVDPLPARDAMPSVAAQAIAAMTERMGWCVTVTAGAERARAAPESLLVGSRVAVLVLHGELRAEATDPSTTWEGMAGVAQSLVQCGARVVAVRIGASAAALAACVEHGAIGVLHVDSLADQLGTLRPALLTVADATRARIRHRRGVDDERWPLPAPFDALTRLTAKERSVLSLLMEGCAAAAIAQRLVVSISTVRAHIRSILVKLNVKSQLAAVAIANGAALTDDAGRR
jgi:DNA-binding NarL/FixJ family response regulator